jgi:hypothetical protein
MKALLGVYPQTRFKIIKPQGPNSSYPGSHVESMEYATCRIKLQLDECGKVLRTRIG